MNQLPRLASIAYHIRRGTMQDVAICQKITQRYNKFLPFVHRDNFIKAVQRGELFVADRGGEVVGFVRWYARKDGWNTLHEVAVLKQYQGIGIGRMLAYSVPCPVRAKVPEGQPSNAFFKGMGFRQTDVEKGRKRRLNIWEMRILTIFCAGDQTRFPAIARETGMAYGTRHTEKPHDKIFMLDVEWERFKKKPGEWDKYMGLVRKYQPTQAMVVDYEYPWQRRSMLRQIHELRRAGVLRILVCPKFDGALNDIPADCIVAISVPSRYAGYLPDFRELKGRPCHLLGGTPQKQRDLLSKLIGHGAKVISLDQNTQITSAKFGSTYSGWNWHRKDARSEPADFYGSLLVSGERIHTQMQVSAEQIPMGI